MDFNKVGIQGRFVADPELAETPSGVPVVTFRIASDSGFGDNKRTNFFNCVAWRNTAESIANFFKKGKQILVYGELQTRSYEDNEGKKRIVTDILVKEFYFCDTRQSDEGNSTPKAENGHKAKPQGQISLEEMNDEDGLPF